MLSFNELKSIALQNNLTVEGDKRLRATWERAVNAFNAAKAESIKMAVETVEGAIECLEETFTYDNAVIAANRIAVWNRQTGAAVQSFTVAAARFIWGTVLVVIGIVLIGIEHLQNSDESIPVFQAIVEQIDQKVRAVIRERVTIYRETGAAAIEEYVTAPAKDTARAITGQHPTKLQARG